MQCQSLKMKKSVLGKYAIPTTNGIYQPIRLFFLNVYYEKKMFYGENCELTLEIVPPNKYDLYILYMFSVIFTKY